MKSIFAIASILAIACIFGCAALGTANTQTPAQIAAQVCPPIQIAITSLQALDGLEPGAQANLAAATPIIDAACAAGATVNATNLQSLAQTALPVIIDIAKASGMAAAQQNQIVLGVTAAQILISTAIQISTPPATAGVPAK